jgi:hypothetical protein
MFAANVLTGLFLARVCAAATTPTAAAGVADGVGPMYLDAETARSHVDNAPQEPAASADAADGSTMALVCSDHWYWKSCMPTEAKPFCKELVCSDQWRWKSIAPKPPKEEPCRAVVCSDHFLTSMKYPRRTMLPPREPVSDCRELVCADHWFFKVPVPVVTDRMRDQLFYDVALWGSDSLSCDDETDIEIPEPLPYVPVPSDAGTPWPDDDRRIWADIDLWSDTQELPETTEELEQDVWDEEDVMPITIAWPRRSNMSDYTSNDSYLEASAFAYPLAFERSSAHEAWVMSV